MAPVIRVALALFACLCACVPHLLTVAASPALGDHTSIVDDAGSLYTTAVDTGARAPADASTPVEDMLLWNVSCAHHHYVPRVPTCHPTRCARRLIDDFVTPEDVATLVRIVDKGMKAAASDGGPTILDLNSGYETATKSRVGSVLTALAHVRCTGTCATHRGCHASIPGCGSRAMSTKRTPMCLTRSGPSSSTRSGWWTCGSRRLRSSQG